MDKRQLCGFCRLGTEAVDICGQFHIQKLPDGKSLAAHHKCLQYSAQLVQYKFENFGGFKIDKVEKEINRGKLMKCHICKAKKRKIASGATAGCAVPTCRRTFHFPCAYNNTVCITRRMQVNLKRSKQSTIMYRVFCSEEHMNIYSQNYIVDELKDSVQLNSSEDEDEGKETKNQNDIKFKKKLMNQSDVKHSPANKDDLLKMSITKTKRNQFESEIGTQTKATEKNYQNISVVEQKSEMYMVNGTDAKASDLKPTGIDDDFELNNLGQKIAENEVTVQPCVDNDKIVDEVENNGKTITPTIKVVPFSELVRKSRTNTHRIKILQFANTREMPPAGVTGELSNAGLDMLDDIKDPEVVHIIDSEDDEVVITDDTPKDMPDNILDKHTDQESDFSDTEDFNTSNNVFSSGSADIQHEDILDARTSQGTSKIYQPSQILDEWFEEAFLDTCLAISGKKFSQEIENLIREKITCHFGISKLLFWQDLPAALVCNEDALPLFMRDLSQMILDKQFKGFADLLMHPEKPADQYQYSLDLYAAFDLKVRKDMEKAVFTVVNNNLAKASEEHSKSLGDLLTVDDEYVMIIVLNNVTDAHCYLRSEFSMKSLVLWDHRTRVNAQPCNIRSSLDHFKRKEFIVMKSMFLEMIGSSYRTEIIPEQWYMVDRNKMATSLARKLGDMISHAKTPEKDTADSDTLVLCLGGIDTDVVNLKVLCRKVFKDAIRNLGKSVQNVVAILDINASDGFVSEQDIFPNTLREGCAVSVYSAFKPDVMPVTCVLIDIRLHECPHETVDSTTKEVDEMLCAPDEIQDGNSKPAHFRKSTPFNPANHVKSTVINRKDSGDAEDCSPNSFDLDKSNDFFDTKTQKYHYIVDNQKPSTSRSKVSRKRKRVSENHAH